ncbi:MAG: polyphosphate kinase 1 [Gemmatimonadota bacterium]|nr:MAG: polyphosphate kinase 1 [Gemmatimonadota bacterium]
MIRRFLQAPLVQTVGYYILLAVALFLLSKVFPLLQSPFSMERARELLGAQDLPPEFQTEAGESSFLAMPYPALRTLIAVIGALLLVIPITKVYITTKSQVRYDQSMVHTLVMLPIAVTGIVIIVQDSVALAFSLAGIVAAVRFRHTLQDTKDAVYIFLAIAVGLAAGVEALAVAFVVSSIFSLVSLYLWRFNIGDIYGQEVGPAAGLQKGTAVGEAPALPKRRRGSLFLDTKALLALPETEEPERPAAATINPDLSLLEFQGRVLALAEDPDTPLLARLRFLSIFGRNIDEFFMVKVGGLKQAVAEGITRKSIDGRTPKELLNAITMRMRAVVRRQYRCFDELRTRGLEPNGIRILTVEQLDPEGQEYLRSYFDERVFPLLTPKAITTTPGHPLPYVEELLLSMALVVRDQRTGRDHFVVLDVPDAVPRFIQLPNTNDFVAVEELVRAHIHTLYPNREVLEVAPFRLTRSAEVTFSAATAETFLEVIEDEVKRRPQGAVVRIEVERSMPYPVRDLLLSHLRREEAGKGVPLDPADIYELDGMIDLGAVSELAELPLPEHEYPVFTPTVPIAPDRPVFDVLDERDILVHRPYESYEETVERFLCEAAGDPDVVSIKLTLYRPGGPSRLADALKSAAQAGKDISVFVEVKARFDEELNIFWAKQLERNGIHVVTGLVKHKTHAKFALVVRRAGDALKRYVHIGTGNYNASTGRQYTDLDLLTTNEDLCTDVGVLFNELTGSSRPPAAEFRRLFVAPTYMLDAFQQLIAREAEHARAGGRGYIRAKINGLADAEIIESLYKASQAGVKIDLVVRGICCLRPGVPGLSDNIRVVSAVGRFLEHARIFVFANAGSPEFYIGSADWRGRNLRRRVEVVTPVADPQLQARLDEILEIEVSDPKAWDMQTDGSYVPRTAGAGALSAQEEFLSRLVTV